MELDKAYIWPYYGDGYPLYENDPVWMSQFRKLGKSGSRPTLNTYISEDKDYYIPALIVFLILFIFYIFLR